MKALFLFLTCVTMAVCQYNWVWRPEFYGSSMEKATANATFILTNLTSDVIKDTDERIRAIEHIRLNNFRTVSFEVGFLNYVIVEEYRKMIDRYNTSILMGGQLWALETVLYLTEIEKAYWQIDHLVNMQHEIERKYGVISGLRDPPKSGELIGVTANPNYRPRRKRRTRDRLGERIQAMIDRLQTTKKKSTRWWWPLEYGWEIDYYW